MKIHTVCKTCLEAQGLNGPFSWLFADLREGLVFRAECAKGHVTESTIRNPEFEILFDAATLALIDQYYREAIGTYTSALERFYEFYIRSVITLHNLSTEELNKTWCHVEIHSERQYGAFRFVHLMHTGRDFPTKKKDVEAMARIRNRVVHQGKIVNEEDALKYGEYVYNVIIATLDELRENNTRYIDTLLLDQSPGGTKYAQTMLHVCGLGYAPPSFKKALAIFEQRNPWLQPPVDRLQLGELALHSKPQRDVHTLLEELTGGAYTATFRYKKYEQE